jgi:hypothetical protein
MTKASNIYPQKDINKYPKHEVNNKPRPNRLYQYFPKLTTTYSASNKDENLLCFRSALTLLAKLVDM